MDIICRMLAKDVHVVVTLHIPMMNMPRVQKSILSVCKMCDILCNSLRCRGVYAMLSR
jgi:hypothetical protein